MAALIRGCLHVNIEEENLNEDEFYKLWGQTKFYLETVHQVTFKS